MFKARSVYLARLGISNGVGGVRVQRLLEADTLSFICNFRCISVAYYESKSTSLACYSDIFYARFTQAIAIMVTILYRFPLQRPPSSKRVSQCHDISPRPRRLNYANT